MASLSLARSYPRFDSGRNLLSATAPLVSSPSARIMMRFSALQATGSGSASLAGMEIDWSWGKLTAQDELTITVELSPLIGSLRAPYNIREVRAFVTNGLPVTLNVLGTGTISLTVDAGAGGADFLTLNIELE